SGIELFKEKLDKKTKVEDINKAIFELLIDSGAKSKIDEIIEEQKTYKRLDMANESAQIWNILIDILEQMNRILGNTKSNIKEYTGNLEAGLLNYEIGVIPPSLDQVMIGNLE